MLVDVLERKMFGVIIDDLWEPRRCLLAGLEIGIGVVLVYL